MEALSLYKGEYLPEYSYNDWVIPVRNHLRNLYINCVAELHRIFGSRGRHEACAEVCRSAILVEKHEEQFHIWLMESLVAMDKGHEAQKHYEYLTSLFYRDLGLKPSRQIQQALKVIKKSLNDNAQNEVAPEDFRPCDKDINSALFCDSNTFRKLYESEMRKSEKSENQITVVQFIINSSGRILPGNVLDSLTDIFKKSFRKGDLITRLNGSRFAVMLHGIGARHAESVANRAAEQIRTGLDSCTANLSYTLHRIGRGEDDLYKMK